MDKKKKKNIYTICSVILVTAFLLSLSFCENNGENFWKKLKNDYALDVNENDQKKGAEDPGAEAGDEGDEQTLPPSGESDIKSLDDTDSDQSHENPGDSDSSGNGKGQTSGHTHSFSSVVILPTETSRGYTLHSCSCGYSYMDSFTAMLQDQSTESGCDHSFEQTDITVISQPEISHMEYNVLLEPEWDEPIYESKSVCRQCGESFDTADECGDHCIVVHGGGQGYYPEYFQVGTLHHDAVYGDRKVIDQEEVIGHNIGYQCTKCGLVLSSGEYLDWQYDH